MGFSARHSDRIRLAKEQIGNLTAICKCHGLMAWAWADALGREFFKPKRRKKI